MVTTHLFSVEKKNAIRPRCLRNKIRSVHDAVYSKPTHSIRPPWKNLLKQIYDPQIYTLSTVQTDRRIEIDNVYGRSRRNRKMDSIHECQYRLPSLVDVIALPRPFRWFDLIDSLTCSFIHSFLSQSWTIPVHPDIRQPSDLIRSEKGIATFLQTPIFCALIGRPLG